MTQENIIDIDILLNGMRKDISFIYTVLDNNHHKNSMERAVKLKKDLDKIEEFFKNKKKK